MDKDNFRIVFMGTPDFAQESLLKIIEEGFNIVAVITAPDKPSGRGRKLQESAVKKFANQKNLFVLQPTNLKDTTFLKELKNLKADLNVVVAFRMLPEAVWDMPIKGTINLHASLLPDYRGAAPINRAIMNGEQKSGVTTFLIEKEIDTGNILLSEEVDISDKMNAGDLHDILMEKGAKLLTDTINRIISGDIVSIPQRKSTHPKLAPKIHPEDCKIPWENDVQSIYNHIRGLSPYPGAWTGIQTTSGEEFSLKIFSAAYEKESHSFLTPTIIKDKNKEFRVSVPGGFINIIELQMPGKKKMKVQDFLQGNSINEWEIL